MLWRSARGLALLAGPLECSGWLPAVRRSWSSKSSGAERIKLLRKEDKLFFGKLVETKKQKTKRLKLESAGKLLRPRPSTTDSEFSWTLSTSKNLSVLSLQPREPEDSDNAEDRAVGEVEPSSRAQAEGNRPSASPLLPKLDAQHLLQFPIYEATATPADQWDGSSKVMTLSAMANKACLKYPSVTKILSATMSEEAKAVLERWKIQMIEKLGLRGFEIYQAELFANGKLLHSIIMSFLTQKPHEVPDKIKQSFVSLDKVLKDVDQVRAIESHVIHSKLFYRGIVDCIASYRGELCLIDWKKSDKAKNTIGATYDAPLQLASYIGAVNSDSNYPFQIKKGLIVVAYSNGEPAKVHEVSEDSLEMYWKLWLQRLQNYHVTLNN